MSLLNNRKGGITIFLCFIFTALLLLTGVLIDATRIMVAEKKVQGALNSSVRSVLSDYDKGLIGDYGIFGLNSEADGGAEEKMFLSYLNVNILEKQKDFNFIKYEINESATSTNVIGFSNILTNESFKNQIMQYMKYKAPLNVTKSIIDKFSASGLAGKVEFSKSEKKVRAKRKQLVKQIGDTNSGVGKIVSAIGSKTTQELQATIELLNKTNEQNSLADKFFKEYVSESEESDRVANAGNTNAADDKETKINTIREDSKNIQKEITDLAGQLNSNVAKINAFIDKIDNLQKQISKIKGVTKDDLEQISELKKQINDFENNFGLDAMKPISFKEGLESVEPDNPQSKSAVENLKNELEKKLKIIDTRWLINSKEFEAAENKDEEKFQDSKTSQMEINAKSGDEREIEAETKNDNVISYLQNFLDTLTNVGKAGIEKMYIVEYAMDRFTYLTSKTQREHYLDKGEVEYLLWGDNNQASNIVKTMGSIWFLRFAIDFIDSFTTSLDAEPISRLITSLVRGLTLSCYDVIQLYQGKEIGICPSLKKSVTLNYSDHLRVFLLLKASTQDGEVSVLDNMRQLIQVNLKQTSPGFQLKNYNTALKGNVEVKMNLWFLPLFQLDKLNLKNFSGGKYIISKEIYTGY